ncbi:MAG: amidohydrolase family protein [Acidobacteriota bacterium]|nr:amidohydrolase family protein [Acidobacteriota bacterium]
MKKRTIFCVVAYFVLGVDALPAQENADTILYNGKILTVDSHFSIAEAVAVYDDEIVGVGRSSDVLKLAGSRTLRINLRGKTVVPGLIHTHVHMESPGRYGRNLPAAQSKRYPLNFRIVKTKEDVIEQIQNTIAAFNFKPGEWIQFSTNPSGEQARLLFDELNRWELDKGAPDNPIFFSLGVPILNMVLVNSKAIEALWNRHGEFVETYGRYWVDETGQPEGHLEAPAARVIVQEFAPEPDVEIMAPLYKMGLEERAAVGNTTISGGLHGFSVEVYKWLDERDEMPVRYGYGVSWTFGIPGANNRQFEMGSGTDMVWINSMSARGVDGAGSRMCISLKRDSEAVAMSEGGPGSLMGLSAVSEWWPHGQCNLDIEYGGATKGAPLKANYFMEWFNQVAQDGLRSANLHVSGDESYSRLLSALERIDRANPGAVQGWGMDHCTMVNPKDIPRAAKLGIMWSCQPLGEGDRAPMVAEAFGDSVAHTYVAPIKSMLDAGINVSLEGLWSGIETLITRKDEHGRVWGPDQRVDKATALQIATRNGAEYVQKGDRLGSIEVGKLADLVVLDRDYLMIPEEEISEIRSSMTLLGGKIIFLHPDFSQEHKLMPEGALISTLEKLRERR